MFRNPFSFQGRIRRTEYGFSLIIMYGAIFFFAVIAEGIGDDSPAFALLLIPIYWFLFAQGAKRCHDRNNSGWYQLIPFYGLWMLFAEGDRGMNDYGEDPKARGHGSDGM